MTKKNYKTMKNDYIPTNENLFSALTNLMNEYARRFCEKYDYSQGWWVADDPVGTYCTDGIEVSISASDLVYCVDNDVDAEEFESWWRYILGQSENPNPINLRSWVNGMRPEMLKGGKK